MMYILLSYLKLMFTPWLNKLSHILTMVFFFKKKLFLTIYFIYNFEFYKNWSANDGVKLCKCYRQIGKYSYLLLNCNWWI